MDVVVVQWLKVGQNWYNYIHEVVGMALEFGCPDDGGSVCSP